MKYLRIRVRKIEAQLRKGAVLSPEGRQKLRQSKQALLEHDHGDGAVAARRGRATGALRVLYRPGTQVEAEDGWFVICEDHKTCLSTDTRKLGESAMADPDWCEECQEKSSN